MKLLKKSTAQAQIANQRKQQIDEGLLLVSKIEALRKSLAELERQHQEFVASKQAEMEAILIPLKKEIDYRTLELADLEVERQRLLAPLDEEWQRIGAEKAKLEADKGLVQKGLKKIAERDERTKSLNQETKDTLYRIHVRERELKKIYAKIDSERLEAETLKEDIVKSKAESDAQIEAKVKELLEREILCAVKERENEIAKSQNEDERKEIIITKAQLVDQRETLERALNRT